MHSAISRQELHSSVWGKLSLLALGTSLLMSQNQPVSAKEINLLQSEGLTLLDSAHAQETAVAERALRDGDEDTPVEFSITAKQTAQYLYHFENGVVAPRQLRIRSAGIDPNKVKIEILVSTLSQSTGFKSLRTEPLRTKEGWQSFKFDQVAAQWVIIKFIPFGEKADLRLTEIELLGENGPPKPVYAFNESPAEALEVLKKLPGVLEVKPTSDELSIFADAKDGKFDEWSFAEASLISAGVHDKPLRQRLMIEIDALTIGAKKAVASKNTAFERGEALLKWLHEGPFKKGYVEAQTDVSTVLESNIFNCVSSATLYNIIGRRIGLDLRGIEVPTHAFSILYDGLEHADVETTTQGGFNPERNREGAQAFSKLTGFNHIPDKYRDQRREITDPGMAALTYYNHGVFLTKEKNYPASLVSYFKALSLDPENESTVKNAISTLGRWSRQLIDADKPGEALSILEVGYELAPTDVSIKSNLEYATRLSALALMDSGNSDEALSTFTRVHNLTRDDNYLAMQSWIFTQKGEALIKEQNWEDAYQLVSSGEALVTQQAKAELTKWKRGLFLRWSSAQLDVQQFDEAIATLLRAYEIDREDYSVKSQIAYAVQELGRAEQANSDFEAGLSAVMSNANKMTEISGVSDVAANYMNREAHRLMDGREFEKALDLYQRAIAAFPKNYLFHQNIGYAAQEWSREVSERDGVEAGEKLIASLVQRFPDIYQLRQGSGRLAYEAVLKILDQKQFEEAAELLESQRDLFTDKNRFDNLAVNVYYAWAEFYRNQNDDEKMIAIFALGYEKYPDNYKMRTNAKAAWDTVGGPFIDRKEWSQAIDLYARAFSSLPDESGLRRNIVYVAQEWARSIASEQGPVAGEQKIVELAASYPDIDEIAKMKGRLISDKYLELTKAGDFETAETFLFGKSEYFQDPGRYDNLITGLYFNWSKPDQAAEKWASVVAIFKRGHTAFPENTKTKQNLEWALDKGGRHLVESEQWNEALTYYRKGIEVLPESSLFKRIIEFAENKLKQ